MISVGRTKTYMMIIALLLVGCAKQTFEPLNVGDTTNSNEKQSDEISSNFFKISDSSVVINQDNLEENRTAVSFQVVRSDGTFVNDLTMSQLDIIENKIGVTNFRLSSNSQNIVQTVDIVFAVDITWSMRFTIETAKAHLVNFVRETRARGYHTRMCLITFGDYTVKNCDKFYDNNPDDPGTETQVAELISEISKLKALGGGDGVDPGGEDFPENPMRALIDASNAPWSENSQRFAILITDDNFLILPENKGVNPKATPPRYDEVLKALSDSQMKVFAATSKKYPEGYRTPYQGKPSVVTASQGEHFVYEDLAANKINLTTILNRIISKVKTTYLAEYVSEENQGLDPSLPLKNREIVLSLKQGVAGTLVSKSMQSNLPDGRVPYKKKWKLSDKKIRKGTLKVKINGFEIPGGFQVEAGEIDFAITPPKGAKIEVSFDYDSLADALQFQPIRINGQVDLNAVAFYFNGKKAGNGFVSFQKDSEGHWTVQPTDRAMTEEDPFEIRKNKGLEIKIYKVK